MAPEILLTNFDYIMLIWVSIGMPLTGYLFHLQSKKHETEGKATSLSRDYIITILTLIIPTFIILSGWVSLERPLNALGFGFEHSSWGLGALVLSLVIGLVFLGQYIWILKSPSFREKIKTQIENSPGIEKIFPSTSLDYLLFKLLSLVAGTTEEILFRAFLIWGFSFYMNIWLASGLAILVFSMGHLYQEKLINIIKVGLTGTFLTGLYLASNSLIPPIIAHIAFDLGAGAAFWAATKTAPK